MSATDLRVAKGGLPDMVKFVVVSQDGTQRTYEAEKRKLASSSVVFRDMFGGPSSPVETNIIVIKNFSPRAFKVMLKHVYQKQYSLDDWNLSLEVFRVAEKYRLLSLQEECEDYFSRTPIQSSNALEVYKYASKYNIQRLLVICEEVFENDSGILLAPGFIHAEKDTVKKIIQHKTQLLPLQMLSLINWGRFECHRRGISVNGENIEKCVIGVCGTSLAISISKFIEKLKPVKKEGDIKKTVERKAENHDVLISLTDSVGGTILDSFNVDIICEVKISVFNCILEFTGLELRLKSYSGESSLEVFYSAENMSEGISIPDTKVDDAISERKEITFAKGLIVKSRQFANITVRIEDVTVS